jgi:ATP-dependent DNA helicase RecG
VRPFSLDPLFRPLTSLAGVGPKSAKLLEKLLGGGRVLDLIFHRPSQIRNFIHCDSLRNAPDHTPVIISVTIEKHMPPARRALPWRVRASDVSGFVELVYFNAKADWLEKQLPINSTVTLRGEVEPFRGGRQMIHGEKVAQGDAAFEITYPLTAGLSSKILRKIMLGALGTLPALPEWQDASYFKKQKWDGWKESVISLHNPTHLRDLEPTHPARMRLSYDELLANQLALAFVRQSQRKDNGYAFETKGKYRTAFEKLLPWELTAAQKDALNEIDADMGTRSRMLRLLQGDVGSGKTIVAALAMMNAVDSGAQAALMVPTEILARQHAQTLTPFMEKLGLTLVTLTGRDKGKEREALRAKVASGEAHIVIGTHALFQESVAFHDLGLAVIDEQHRFGVHQRLSLSNKGKGVDILVMTATPIPRTLTLTAYGDMDVSRILTKPPGRKPVDTRLIPQERFDEMQQALSRKIAEGAQIYWVCPLVEESEILDLAAAEERYAELKEIFGDKVGLIHGRMKAADKDSVMQKFLHGDVKILVATTVIEVGVNVPQATIMVIEHAERFGLAQLHQLRGRVGRGADQSYCFLVYAGKISETARERLNIMRQTEDGFLIAEKDLSLRGGGEILGTKQSGLPTFRIADPIAHTDLLLAARDDSQLILARDPELKTPRGQALRVLLYLFERDQAISFLRSG